MGFLLLTFLIEMYTKIISQYNIKYVHFSYCAVTNLHV